MRLKKIKIGLVGCGSWGQNLARNCHNLGILYSVTDINEKNALNFSKKFGCKSINLQNVFMDKNIDGIIISTPGFSHYEIALKAIKEKKHVFIEKPMTLSLKDSIFLEKLANKNGVQIMVGHLIRYHPAFIKLLEIINSGIIGKIKHIQANRIAFGRILNCESVLFDLCPHDLSLILSITKMLPKNISGFGICHTNKAIIDIISAGFSFKTGITASINTSWISPVKEHKFIVTGSLGSLEFDDTKPWSRKLIFYEDIIKTSSNKVLTERKNQKFISINKKEPLKEEMLHFINVCKNNIPAITNGAEGILVQKVLEEMSKKLIYIKK